MIKKCKEFVKFVEYKIVEVNMSNDVSNVALTKELIEIIKSSKEKAF